MDAQRNAIDPASVLGWGVDADPRNDPTFPMRDRTREDKGGNNWPRPAQQRSGVEILHSIEHAHRPAVVGTSTPPSGLSGSIRRVAFRFSESQWMHWLMLIFADRVNVVEGNLGDLARGRFPNHIREMGLRSEWRYNKSRVIRRGLIGLALVGAAAVTISWLLED